MPTTRRQAAEAEKQQQEQPAHAGTKRPPTSRKETKSAVEPPPKKSKPASGMGKDDVVKEPPQQQHVDEKHDRAATKDESHAGSKSAGPWHAGVIERGHIYFFYRPKVQLEEVSSVDDVKNFHMLLVPRPPEFASGTDNSEKPENPDQDREMAMLQPGADAVPAEPDHTKQKFYRLITLGKKQLPDPEHATGGRKETFWATVTAVGKDLESLEKGLDEKSYETKTRGKTGTRHQAPARLVARGAYAIVNNNPRVPSGRETHLGYRLSHPSVEDITPNSVQAELGIHPANSFVVQVKNPLAPSTNPAMRNQKGAEYPEDIMRDVFGKGGSKGRESYGLRFASCERPELLNYEGAQLLFIAARDGDDGLEASLGDGRGEALSKVEKEESREPVSKVFSELGLDLERFPAKPLGGEWI
ncbi:hypothetical protein HDZ31DRAFT_28585 [Schizophyllum fasciatum]